MQNKPHDDIKNICGARTRKGTPCQQIAGWGTNHVGTGRCKLHGGKSTGPKNKSKLKENKNAEKHGLFTKYLPQETLDIINEIQEKDSIDLLWNSIMLQYGAIIRSQQIMYVKDREEMIKELKKSKYEVVPDKGEIKQIPTELEYEFQFAWDRQATFLQAQSRAMAELRNMIAKYEELCKSDMATEEQRLRIEKLKVDIEKVREDKGDKSIKVTIVDDVGGEGDGN